MCLRHSCSRSLTSLPNHKVIVNKAAISAPKVCHQVFSAKLGLIKKNLGKWVPDHSSFSHETFRTSGFRQSVRLWTERTNSFSPQLLRIRNPWSPSVSWSPAPPKKLTAFLLNCSESLKKKRSGYSNSFSPQLLLIRNPWIPPVCWSCLCLGPYGIRFESPHATVQRCSIDVFIYFAYILFWGWVPSRKR